MKKRAKPKVLVLSKDSTSACVAKLAGAMALAQLPWNERNEMVLRAQRVAESLIDAAQGSR